MNKNILSDLLHARKANHMLPQEFYTDESIFDIDLKVMFESRWLAVGHECEIKKTGDYFTRSVGKNPIIVVRDNCGSVRSFYNVCRHRASTICNEPSGSKAKFMCPYHQWSYSLEGLLISSRGMGEDFDMRLHPLRSVNLEVVGGIIYICLSNSPPEFSQFKEILAPYFSPHGITELKVAFEDKVIVNGNWKLVWENFRECLHCPVGHPSLIKSFPQYEVPGDPMMPESFLKRICSRADEWENIGAFCKTRKTSEFICQK